MKLTAYVIPGLPFGIRPAGAARDWMDATASSFANRCLPLMIANQHGWELICAQGFSAVWSGGAGADGVTVTPEGEPMHGAMPVSHFGHGILTFHVPALFRTEAGLNMMVMGPVNQVRHGIQPLTGIVETDWAPYSFTMNWMFTAPDSPVRFARGDAFCHLMPVPRGLVEAQEPEIRNLHEEAEVKAAFDSWSKSRTEWNRDTQIPGTQAHSQGWQKAYFQGKREDGSRAESHQTKLKVRPFEPRTETREI